MYVHVFNTFSLSKATDHHRSIDRMACSCGKVQSLRSCMVAGRSLGLLKFSTIKIIVLLVIALLTPVENFSILKHDPFHFFYFIKISVICYYQRKIFFLHKSAVKRVSRFKRILFNIKKRA